MYKLTRTGTIQRLTDGAFIPPDEKNADYQKYQVWIAASNVPTPADPPPAPAPAQLTAEDLAAVLIAKGTIAKADIDAKLAESAAAAGVDVKP